MQVDIYGSSSKGNSYRISDGKTNILLDCGLPFKTIQEKSGFAICDIHACLISHEHL